VILGNASLVLFINSIELLNVFPLSVLLLNIILSLPLLILFWSDSRHTTYTFSSDTEIPELEEFFELLLMFITLLNILPLSKLFVNIISLLL
jgi:hypothetical protein